MLVSPHPPTSRSPSAPLRGTPAPRRDRAPTMRQRSRSRGDQRPAPPHPGAARPARRLLEGEPRHLEALKGELEVVGRLRLTQQCLAVFHVRWCALDRLLAVRLDPEERKRGESVTAARGGGRGRRRYARRCSRTWAKSSMAASRSPAASASRPCCDSASAIANGSWRRFRERDQSRFMARPPTASESQLALARACACARRRREYH